MGRCRDPWREYDGPAHRRGLSLVDCTSFAIMRRQAITRAFHFDRHFQEQGFEFPRLA
jgi:predicted nucleic acid-binding protein